VTGEVGALEAPFEAITPAGEEAASGDPERAAGAGRAAWGEAAAGTRQLQLYFQFILDVNCVFMFFLPARG
jgi:hypothetical protein